MQKNEKEETPEKSDQDVEVIAEDISKRELSDIENIVDYQLNSQRRVKWSQVLKTLRDYITKDDFNSTTDRLTRAKMLHHIIFAMYRSTQEWHKLMTNLDALDRVTTKEIRKIYPQLRELALTWIDLDIAISEKKENQIDKEVRERAMAAVMKVRQAALDAQVKLPEELEETTPPTMFS